jgi:CDP-diacylglycerol--serine O-phosphatidyltransferase
MARFDLKKALFILPNALTLSSVFCGMYAIIHATSGGDQQALFQSAIAIFFAGFFDMFDGRVARMTRTQSEFGVQMDSLADVISFGVAPAVVVYKWALWPLGAVGLFGAFCFAACGTIRLARFNVLAASGSGSSRFFLGLPIPLAAAMLVALVIAHYRIFEELPVRRHTLTLSLVLVLAGLMVSNVRYRTFKDFKLSSKNLPYVLTLALLAGAITVATGRPSVTLVALFGGYIGIGLLADVPRVMKKRRSTDQSATSEKLAAQGTDPEPEAAQSKA